MTRPTYRATARLIWRDASWIDGSGPFAVAAYCNVNTVTLHGTAEAAMESLLFIERIGCGHCCTRRHSLYRLPFVGVDLAAEMPA